MNSRYEAILRDVARSRLSIRRVLQRRMNVDPANVIKKLVRRGLLVARDGQLPQNVSAYQVTAEAVQTLALPERAAETITDGAEFHRTIAMMWWCGLGRMKAIRLESEEVERLTGVSTASGHHVLAGTNGDSCLFNVTVPSEHAKLPGILDRLLARVELLREPDALQEWVRARQYGYLILLHDGKWKETQSFGRDELLVLAKVADQAHSKIHELQSEAREAA